jgi:hypothetical protein
LSLRELRLELLSGLRHLDLALRLVDH